MAKSTTSGTAAPRRKAAPAGRRAPAAAGAVSARFWLAYPPQRIQEPLIWELARRFEIVTNIRQASVTDQLGIVCLEVSGTRKAVDDAVRWLKRKGVSVEPVELSTVAG